MIQVYKDEKDPHYRVRIKDYGDQDLGSYGIYKEEYYEYISSHFVNNVYGKKTFFHRQFINIQLLSEGLYAPMNKDLL